MTQPFTPRATSRTASPAEAVVPAPKKVVDKTVWQVWKPRLVVSAKWAYRQLRRIGAMLVRYTHRLTRTQRLQHAGSILALIACIFMFNQIFSRTHPTAPTTQPIESGAALPKESPTFSTLLPRGKSADDLGGWRRVSPSDRNPVYAYPDMLAGSSIIVSEQPLPDGFSSDPGGSIEKLAEGYSADRTFDASGTTVYVGKSAKGPQSLIFTKHGLLILIKSSTTITDDVWRSYVKSLQ